MLILVFLNNNVTFFGFNFIFFGCVGSSLLYAGFLQLRRAGATLRCGAWASHCGGFSCCRARALGAWAQQLWLAGSRAQARQLWHAGSVVAARGLQSAGSVVVAHGLSSCGARAQLLHGLWDLPGPGIEPVSPALAGRFLSTAPPGKSQCDISYLKKVKNIMGVDQSGNRSELALSKTGKQEEILLDTFLSFCFSFFPTSGTFSHCFLLEAPNTVLKVLPSPACHSSSNLPIQFPQDVNCCFPV